MADLTQTLAGEGPALGFGQLHSTYVPSHIAIVVGTSGSTGAPKEVGFTAAALHAATCAAEKFIGARLGDRWSLLLPLTHIAGVNVLLRSLALGSEPLDLRKVGGSQVEQYGDVDFTSIVPTQLHRALHGDSELLEHLKNCRAVLVGGAALPENLRQQATESGIKIITTYGMTETSGGCVYNGSPLESVQVEIAGNGLIKIAGPHLASQYLNDPAQWREVLIDGWFHTNDLGRFSDTGELIVLGRSDEIIISGGEKISLTTIENYLQEKFTGTVFAAFAIDDPEWGAALHIAIIDNLLLSISEVSAHLDQEFGRAGKPKGFLHLPTLPLLGIGKVDRKKLAHLAELAQTERQAP